MISQEIKSVAGTKLFCGVNDNKKFQLTVYANTVDNPSRNNAMVLPVPFPKSVVFHNLENYKTFFSDCDNSFEKPLTRSSRSLGLLSSNSSGSRTLAVYDIGSYKVSLANSLDDLKLVNSEVFDLSDGMDKMLKNHYYNPVFGFIICKLAEGNEKYHPFAYSHAISKGKVFIPTKHYHDESNYTKSINMSPMFRSMAPNLEPTQQLLANDWDHEIYLYNINVDSNANIGKMNICNERWSGKSNIRLNKIDFPLGKCRVFDKLKINGTHRNIDLIFSAC
jgi:hypothetical protein